LVRHRAFKYVLARATKARYKVGMTDASASQQLFDLFTYLSDVRLNFWFYLFFLLPPLLIFSVRPEEKAWLRVARTVVAVASAYILINLSLQTHRSIIWHNYEACQSQFSDGAIQHHEECGKIDIGDGASNVFYLFLGWIPGAAYVSIWELMWRRYYHRQLAESAAPFRLRWITSFPIWILYACLAYPIIAIAVAFIVYWGQWSLLFQK
jgi:hypothetical protein